MKKLLLILALSMFSFANAQKGTILVSGNISYNSQKSGDSGSSSQIKNFNFSPKMGYQYNDNWTLGVESSVNSYKYGYENSQELNNNKFLVGGFLRYSKTLSEIFSVYADLGVGYQYVKYWNITGDNSTLSKTKENGYYIGITPAIYLNLKKNFGLNFNIGGLGYDTLNNTTNNGTDTKSFNFSFGQAFSVGISKNF
ncbi:MAG: porin family protein [Flavobacterium sp.]|nr:porin family protein [Flavobacterium sp.]